MIPAIDCQGFAGGFTLGMQQAGFSVVAKRENIGGFGVPLVESNAPVHFPHLTEIEVCTPENWRPRRVPVVFGNPPCSGFSSYTGVNPTLAAGAKTGHDHPINECMWDLVRYAAACKAEIVVMESVQLAYSKGRGLMRELRDEMERETGKRYDLIHVLHNNAAVGGSSIRRRYFMVLARRPLKFGVLPPAVGDMRLTHLADLLADLETQPLSWDVKPYRRKKVEHLYPRELRAKSGLVDGHEVSRTKETDAIAWIAANSDWQPSEHVGDPLRRIVNSRGFDFVPAVMKYQDGKAIKKHLLTTDAYSARRWHPHKVPGVITGTGTIDVVHPILPRTITFRESARILGFPDDWSLASIGEKHGQRLKYLGKGISVPCGRWIGGWVRDTLNGSPGPWRGEKIGDQEWVIDVTNDHKQIYDERTGEFRDSRSKVLVKAMEAREW